MDILFIKILLSFANILANERIIFELRENGTKPSYVLDGMTSDIDGNLFITTFGGHKVMKIDPT